MPGSSLTDTYTCGGGSTHAAWQRSFSDHVLHRQTQKLSLPLYLLYRFNKRQLISNVYAYLCVSAGFQPSMFEAIKPL